MLEGVTILSQEPILDPSIGLPVFIVGAIICIIISIIISWWDNDVGIGIFICFVGTLMSLVIGMGVGATMGEPTGEYTYKVTIDDSVSMTEFYEHYTIIDQEGKIFTVELKERK